MYSQLSLTYVIEGAKTFEYRFLEKYDGIDLAELQRARMSGSEFCQYVLQAQGDLQRAFTDTHSRTNNGETSCSCLRILCAERNCRLLCRPVLTCTLLDAFVIHGYAISVCSGGTTIDMSTLAVEKDSLMQSGELTVAIPLPNGTSYYGTTFSDVRVFLVAPSTAAGRSPVVSVAATKAGSSVLQDSTGAVHRFTHEQTDPPFHVQYDGGTNGACSVYSTVDTRLSDNYTQFSPHCTWTVAVDARTICVDWLR